MKHSLNSLQEAYTFIEENQGGTSENYDFASSLKELLDNTSEESEKEKIQWEIDCFQFMLGDGKAKPFISSTSKDGKEYGYPSYESCTAETYKYWAWRSEEVTNPYLIIRYNQVLWNGNSKIAKNQKFAKKAVDAYFQLMNTQLDGLDSESQYQFIDLFKNGFSLSAQINYRLSEYKTLWNKLIFQGQPITDYWKSNLIEFALKNRRFKKIDFKNVVAVCLNSTHKEAKGRDLWDNEQILETALKVAKRTGENLAPIHIRLGENYEASAEHRMNDDSRMVPLTFLNQALEHYQEAKHQTKIEEVAVRLAELRKGLKLHAIPFSFDSEEIQSVIKAIREKAKKILNHEPDEIYTYLANGDDHEIFPKREWLEKSAKERSEKPSPFDFIHTSYVDINNNQTTGETTEEEKLTKELYDNFGWHLKLFINPFLQTLFVEGVKSGKLTYLNFIEFAYKRSWLGQTFSESSGGGELREYNWISAIAPAIQEYFFNTKAAIMASNFKPNYLLAIDSLTLKFEGILRNFAQLIKAKTIRYSQKNQGTREMYIEEIMESPKIQEYFNQEDVLLFKYVLLGQGMNLRNNIAHCFFKYPDYNYLQIHLLILCILRLGKYHMKQSD